jgi:hypothetical protein
MKLDRSTIWILLGIVIVIFIFNIFTREGFYEDVVVSGTGLSVGPITGKPAAPATKAASARKASRARATATPAPTSSSAMDLPAATMTVQPTAPLVQVGSSGMKPISTQQVTDMAGTKAVASIQKGVVSTDSMPAAIAPTRGSIGGPTMGASCKSSSIDSCGSDNCDSGSSYDSSCDNCN